MTKQDLIREAFKKIDTFKRHRALYDIESFEKRSFHELQMYKMIDQLELSLRAINKELREAMMEETTA